MGPAHHLSLLTSDFLVDKTLALLYNSSSTRGLPHKLTRNITLLMWAKYHQKTVQVLPHWNPQLAPNDPAYKIPARPLTIDELKQKDVMARAWAALGHVVKMAEGQTGLSLGRVRIRAKVRERTGS